MWEHACFWWEAFSLLGAVMPSIKSSRDGAVINCVSLCAPPKTWFNHRKHRQLGIRGSCFASPVLFGQSAALLHVA